MISDSDRSEGRRLLEAATDGSWRVSEGGMSRVVVRSRGQRVDPVAECWGENSHADAALICWLRNHATELLEGMDPDALATAISELTFEGGDSEYWEAVAEVRSAVLRLIEDPTPSEGNQP